MRIDVITTFPDVVKSFRDMGIVGRAFERDLASLHDWDLREFADNSFKHIDDEPFGGGAGMVIKADPIFKAFEAIHSEHGSSGHRIFLSPQGQPFTQETAERLKELDHLTFLCGRYKGVDERVRESLIDEELSIGNFVLSGGELAAFVIIDAVVRRIPGAVNDEDSTDSDTFPTGLLDAPYYTRPATYRGMEVPEVLRSGHHAEIEKWRHEQRLARTRERRPDLYARYLKELEEQNEQGE